MADEISYDYVNAKNCYPCEEEVTEFIQKELEYEGKNYEEENYGDERYVSEKDDDEVFLIGEDEELNVDEYEIERIESSEEDISVISKNVKVCLTYGPIEYKDKIKFRIDKLNKLIGLLDKRGIPFVLQRIPFWNRFCATIEGQTVYMCKLSNIPIDNDRYSLIAYEVIEEAYYAAIRYYKRKDENVINYQINTGERCFHTTFNAFCTNSLTYLHTKQENKKQKLKYDKKCVLNVELNIVKENEECKKKKPDESQNKFDDDVSRNDIKNKKVCNLIDPMLSNDSDSAEIPIDELIEGEFEVIEEDENIVEKQLEYQLEIYYKMKKIWKQKEKRIIKKIFKYEGNEKRKKDKEILKLTWEMFNELMKKIESNLNTKYKKLKLKTTLEKFYNIKIQKDKNYLKKPEKLEPQKINASVECNLLCKESNIDFDQIWFSNYLDTEECKNE